MRNTAGLLPVSEAFKAAATAAVEQLFATGNLTIDILSVAGAQPAPETVVGVASGTQPAAVMLHHAPALPQGIAAAPRLPTEDRCLPRTPLLRCLLQQSLACLRAAQQTSGQAKLQLHSVQERILPRAAASAVLSALWTSVGAGAVI